MALEVTPIRNHWQPRRQGQRTCVVKWPFRLSMPLLALLAANARAQAGDAPAGKATFISICSSCHGLEGIATLDYAPSFAKCERLQQPDATLMVSVRDGIGGRMPPWGTILSENQILDAIAYARTFCKRPPSNPPPTAHQP